MHVKDVFSVSCILMEKIMQIARSLIVISFLGLTPVVATAQTAVESEENSDQICTELHQSEARLRC